MTAYSRFVFFLIVQVIHFLGTWKLYEAADRKRWEAAIPVYNAIILMKIIGRPSWWTLLLFIPIINPIIASRNLGGNLEKFWKTFLFGQLFGHRHFWFLHLLHQLHPTVELCGRQEPER